MLVIDPGHTYLLGSLDGPLTQTLVFVKRDSESHPNGYYPGNEGHHPGTNIPSLSIQLKRQIT